MKRNLRFCFPSFPLLLFFFSFFRSIYLSFLPSFRAILVEEGGSRRFLSSTEERERNFYSGNVAELIRGILFRARTNESLVRFFKSMVTNRDYKSQTLAYFLLTHFDRKGTS